MLDEIKNLRVDFKSLSDNISQRMNKMEDNMKKLSDANSRLEKEIKRANDRIDSMEAQSRRDNLLFFGLEGQPNETWKDSEQRCVL